MRHQRLVQERRSKRGPGSKEKRVEPDFVMIGGYKILERDPRPSENEMGGR